MQTDWTPTTIGACADQLAGFAFKSKHFGDDETGDGLRLLRGDNIAPGRLRWAGARTYPPEMTETLDRYELHAGDVVIAMDRPWIDAGLKVAQVLSDDRPCLLVQRVTRLRGSDTVEGGFLWAVVRSGAFMAHLRAETTGTAVPHISGSQIASFAFNLPSPREQRAIASVLGVLDGKIESNRSVAAALSDIVLSQSAHASRQAKQTTSLSVIAAQFKVPGVDDAPYVGLDVMPPGSTVLNTWTTENAPTGASWSFDAGDVLYGKLRPYFRKVAVAPISGRCTREIVVLRPVHEKFYGLLVGTVASRAFIEYCTAISSGTKMPRAEWKDASKYTVGLPDDDVLATSSVTARRSFEMVSTLVRESRSLAAIRDALLPKLVSGQIRVPLSDDSAEALGAALDAQKAQEAQAR